MLKNFAALATVVFLAAVPAAAGAGDLSVTGAVMTPLHLTPGALRAMPATEVVFTGKQGGTYKGVLLYVLLDKASLKDKSGKNAFLQHTIMVTGSDGYAAALAVGEFDPNYEAKTVILAYDIDGRPLRDGYRLVVPGEKEGGRQVHDVVKIDVQ